MTEKASGKVPVTFAKGLLDDVAELTATTTEDDQVGKDEAEALKQRIAELLVECKDNPFTGELMGVPPVRQFASQFLAANLPAKNSAAPGGSQGCGAPDPSRVDGRAALRLGYSVGGP